MRLSGDTAFALWVIGMVFVLFGIFGSIAWSERRTENTVTACIQAGRAPAECAVLRLKP